MHLVSLLALSALFAVKGVDTGPSGAQEIELIKNALRAELMSLTPRREDPATIERYSAIQSALHNLSYIEANLDNPEAERNVTQIPVAARMPKLEPLCEKAVKALRQRREAADAREIADVEEALKDATDILVKSKKPEELDPVLSRLRRINGSGSYRSSSNRALSEARGRVNSAMQTVQRWQDGLYEEQAGNPDGARNHFRSIANDSSLGLDIPRSLLLSRAREVPAKSQSQPGDAASFDKSAKTNEILAKIKKPEDLADAIETIASLPDSQRNQMEPLKRSIDELQRTYVSLRNGAPTSISLTRASEYSGALAEVQMHLLRLAIPRVLELPDGQAPKPGEKLDAFVDRTMEAACKAGDWRLGLRCLKARNSLATSIGTGAPETSDSRAIESYLAGCAQSEARQYKLAVASYQTALKSGSKFVPSKEIGDRLETIKQASAKEYEEGVALFLSPPAPNYSNYPDSASVRMRGYPPGFFPPGVTVNPADPRGSSNQPGAPNQPGQLDVPGAKSAHSPSPTLAPTATPSVTASPVPAS